MELKGEGAVEGGGGGGTSERVIRMEVTRGLRGGCAGHNALRQAHTKSDRGHGKIQENKQI